MNLSDNFFETINKISKNDFDHENINLFFDSAKYLLENASKKNQIKDKFTCFYYKPSTTLNCFLESEKTKSKYNLLYDIYKNEIVFYSDILNWENIRNINDSFWQDFLATSKELNFQFNPHGGIIYDKETTPEFNSNYKSVIFNLMSVYVTSMLESEQQRENISFGQLEITWTPTKGITEILKELNIAFKIFYKLNYLLWKTEDIRKQNQINRRKNK